MSELPRGYEIRLGTLADCPALPEIERAAAEMFRPLNLFDWSNVPDVVSVERGLLRQARLLRDHQNGLDALDA